MFKSMLSQHLSLPNRFSPCPTFLISKKSFKMTKNFEFYGNKAFMKFFEILDSELVPISSYPVSFHDFDSSELNDLSDILSEIMLIRTIVNFTTVNHDSSGSLRGQV